MNDETLDQDLLQQEDAETGVYALAASPAFDNDEICFAATATGLLRSSDRASTFSDAYASLGLNEPLGTAAVALSPAFRSDRTVFAGVYGAILRSLDAGLTWHYSLLRTPPPVVTGLAVSPSYEEDGIVFASTLEDGVFRSADRGSRWAAWNFGLIDLGVLCLAVSPAFAQDETLFAGTETGLFRSANGGRAWRECGLPTDLAPVLSLAISADYAQDGRLWAGTESNGLWTSADGGASWSPVEGLAEGAVNAVLCGRSENGPALLALIGDTLQFSVDAGQSWREARLSLPERVAAMCAVSPEGLTTGALALVGCSDGAVRKVML